MKPKKSKEVQASNVWRCETCNNGEEMNPEQCKEHLRAVHDVTEFKGYKQLRMHMDGDTWFAYEWNVTVESPRGEVKLLNATVSPRAKDDLMRFA